ncbi:MAG: hypothetical protein HY761_09700, partial [Candidatus Omnitrophica bacterium]|nr:hypothetical protein [Candidatus Omnitrophota bacterium]
DNIPEELKNTDISTIVSSENNNTFKSQVKTSCSEALKKLLEEGIADKSAAISLKEQGYTAYEIVSAYIEKAVGYVKEKTVELINCAALALAGILNTKEQASEIAIEIIYQDILTSGEINIKDGKIQSSMSAIKQTASKHGLELNTYKISLEELNTLKEPAIIHLGTLDNGHWVILTKVSDDSVSIIDNGEAKTFSLEEFKTLSSGNILTTEKITEAQILSNDEASKIFGSGWGKKFKKWRDKMGDKLKSFMNSTIGQIITMIIAIVLTVLTAGALAPALMSSLGATMGMAVANGIGAFVSTLAVCSAKGMKLKDALKTAAITAVAVAVCAGVGAKLSAAGTQTAQAGVQTGTQAGVQTGTQAGAQIAAQAGAQAGIKTSAVKIAIKTAEKAAIKATASYAVQETLKATGNDDQAMMTMPLEESRAQ